MVLVVVLVAFPLVSVGGRGASMEMGGVFDGPEIGAMSSHLVGHESTHLRASKVGEVVQGTT